MTYLQKIVVILLYLYAGYSYAQPVKKDSVATINTTDTANTAIKKNLFSPRKATIRSAILPGWGQVYNRQLWKLPLVYGALGTTAGIFLFNLKEYQGLRKAYRLKVDDDNTNDNQIPERYKPLSANSMRFYRDEYRRNIDYSVLAFIVAWGLNVIDASVSAHLRQFNVSDDLSLQVKPTLNTYGQVGVGLFVRLKDRHNQFKY